MLAVPGAAEGSAGLAAETVGLIDTLQTGADVRVGYLAGPQDDPAALGAVLGALAHDERETMAGAPRAVVVPLVTGPLPRFDAALRQVVAETTVPHVVAQPLGPHPLLAEALHVRLAEAGLARADRVRLVGITTAADGIVLAAVGDAAAAQAVDASAVLLAARLAVPVTAAMLDGTPAVASAAGWLREAGATRVALAPYLLGPEIERDRVTGAAAEADAECAEPLGGVPVVAQLIIDRYTDALEAASAADEHG